MMKTTMIPEFRLPWTYGAKAYPEADTFAAAREGFKRRRKTVIFHMTNDGEAGDRLCVVCGIALREPSEGRDRPDLHSTWDYSPEHKAVGNGRHYICSWTALMNRIFQVA